MAAVQEQDRVIIDDRNLIELLFVLMNDSQFSNVEVRYHPEAIEATKIFEENGDMNIIEASVDLYWIELIYRQVISVPGFGDPIFQIAQERNLAKESVPYSTKTLSDMLDAQKDPNGLAGSY